MTELVRYVDTGMDTMQLGNVLAQSGYFNDAKDAAQAIVKVLAGRELGIGPVASMTGIHIVKGRVTLSANIMAAQIKRSGKYNYVVREMTDKGCTLEFFENGTSVGLSSFTESDARAAGLLGGDNWKKFPRNMYFSRAMSNGAKWFCPDVFSGPVYTPDELSGNDELFTEGVGASYQPKIEVHKTEVLAHIEGAAQGVDLRFSKSGQQQLMFSVDQVQCLAVATLAEQWFDLADGEIIAVTGEWAQSQAGTRYIKVSHIDRPEQATQPAPEQQPELFEVTA